MANSVCEVLLTQARLTGLKANADSGAGAIVEFWGVVRKLEDGREIDGIDYEAHGAMAEHQLAVIAQAAAAKFQLERLLIHHRVGFVAVGEASLFLQVAAAHRGAAFEAGKWIVDELKRKVPIWKHPRAKIDPPSPRLRRGKPASPRLRSGKQCEDATLIRQ
jgi:molybdopterin synthase catalytic subunit